MTSYEQTKAGWDNAAKSEKVDAAIHPAGIKGWNEYQASGDSDANYVLESLYALGIGVNFDEDDCPIIPGSIIDVGCGNGRVTKFLVSKFHGIYAVDFSYAMLQQIPKDMPTIIPVLSVDNWFGLPEPADFAFSISVFIHNTYESGVKLMQAISDNLKPGGLALLQIPVYDEPRQAESWTGVGIWTAPGLEHAAKVTGFNILEMQTNRGAFDYVRNIGPNHHKFQILQKI